MIIVSEKIQSFSLFYTVRTHDDCSFSIQNIIYALEFDT